jgi:hypothetical protein
MKKLLLAVCLILVSKPLVGQTTRLYPVFLAPGKKNVAFIDVKGNIKIKLDTIYQLQDFDGLQTNVFASGKCLLKIEHEDWRDNEYFLLNDQRVIERKFPAGFRPSMISGKFIVVTDLRLDQSALFDLNMRQLTPFQYESHIITFSEGMAYVQKNGMIGWIDENAKESELKFPLKTSDSTAKYPIERETYFNAFHEGLAKYTQNGKYGFIDKDQKIVIPARFEFVSSFSDGLAYAVMEDSGDGYIDHRGNFVIGPHKSGYSGSSFGNGLAPKEDPLTHLYGYIDTKGNFAIEPRYERASEFKRGYAYVQTPGRRKGLQQIINTRGEIVYENFFSSADFSDEHLILLGRAGTFDAMFAFSNNLMYLDYNFRPVWQPDCDQQIIGSPEVLKGCPADKVYNLSIGSESLQHIDSIRTYLRHINPRKASITAHEKIRTFPPEIFQMTNLEELSLAFNAIDSIPPGIEKLKNLKTLDLQFNKIKKLPSGLYKLKQLREINLTYNLLDMNAIVELKKNLPDTKIIFRNDY